VVPAAAAGAISGAVAILGAGAVTVSVCELVLGFLDAHVALVERVLELRVVELGNGRLLHAHD
jgi:hypothetical protein